MQPIIFVINPNSTQAVTDSFDEALNALRLPNGPEIRSLTLKEGPPGVETQINADSVTMPLVALVKALDKTHGDRVGHTLSPALVTPAFMRYAKPPNTSSWVSASAA
jgi:Asp/Glu/hydantoin racemase